MTNTAVATTMLALFLPGVLYMFLALRANRQITSVFQFLPLERFLSADSVRATVVAAGMSMATVMVALLNLAPVMGAALFFTVITYTLGFALLSFAVHKIMDVNPNNLTLQAFLGQAYTSRMLCTCATLFTIAGYLSIFAMEILVSVAILQPFFGDWVLGFAVVYLLFLLIYTGLSGFRGVVMTDKWQLGFILLSVGALLALTTLAVSASSTSVSSHVCSLLGSWKAPLAFFVGVLFMNVPAPFSDAGTWQRICAASSPKVARRGLVGACVLFAVIWGALIICGIALSGSSSVVSHWDSHTEPLLRGVLRVLGTGSVAYLVILFALILGLFSAMISTADSLLIAATQVGLTGLQRHSRLHDYPIQSLRYSRLLTVLLGVVSFAVFIVFHLINLNIVQLVFAIYGAQLAMFPTTATALFFAKWLDLRSLRFFALVSIVAGFTTAWSIGVLGHVADSLNLQFYAPAYGLGAATLVILVGYPFALARKGRKCTHESDCSQAI